MNEKIDVKAIEACLNNVEKFLKHNVQTGHLRPDTTVEGVLAYIKAIRERYIPIVVEINDYVNDVLDK